MNQLVKSVSIENMVNQREAAVALVRQAQDLLLQATELAKAAHLGCLLDVFTPRRYGNEVNFLRPSGADDVIKALDGGGWAYLMNESGMRTFMDAEARGKWDSAMREGDYPALTRDNIAATFAGLHEARGEMFERGVIAVYRRLSWDYKTNQPFKFGKRIIVRGVLSTYGTGKSYWATVNNNTMNELDDLQRVLSVLDEKPEPDHRQGVYQKISQAHSAGRTEWSGDYFSIRWYKKGTGHLTFSRPDLVDLMNRILAKHYPNALADDRR